MNITYGCGKVAILSSLALLICFSLVDLSIANEAKVIDFFKKQDISKQDSKISPVITKSLKLQNKLIELQSDNDPVSKISNPFVKINEAGFVQVYLHLSHISDEVISVLLENEFNLEIVNNDLNIVQGWVSQSKIFDLSDLDFVSKITPPSYGITRQGDVITEGDPVLNSDDVREMFGIDGTGVKVGVISDGVDSLVASKATGDLPNDVTVLEPGNGDEGTAMLETIHDIAPGAELAFSEGLSTTLAFMRSIDELIDICNVDIIVDDISFLLVPYFQDGVVAQKVEEAIASGVIFVTAAGNSADEHYQNLYVQNLYDAGDNVFNLHDFGLASQGPSAISMPIVVGGTAFSPNNFITVVLQWNDPFGGSSNDYDLFLFDEEGAQLVSSTLTQNGTQDPIEVVVFYNNSAQNKLVLLVIERFSGDEKILEMQFNGEILIEDFNVPGDSIFGHAAASNTVTVGAVPVGNPDIIEPFSSLGPVSIFFNPVQVTNSLNSSSPLITTSNNIPTEVRQKPDVVAPDFTSTTVPGFSPFIGSSVSAPHAAGVVALIIEAQAQSQVTSLNNQFNKTNLVNDPKGIIDILKQNAVDLGAPGPDNIFGFGRVDALAAVQAVLPEGPSGCSLVENSNYSGIYSSLFILLVVLSTVFINRFHKTTKRNS